MVKNSDIFAPPSEQELKDLSTDPMFAPPSQEELGGSSTLEDFGTGVHNGMTLGARDELTGLGSAVGSKIGDSDTFQKLANWYYAQKMNASHEALDVANSAKPIPGGQSFYDNYRKGQQEAQAEQDAAAKNSPWAYTGGNLVGGLIPGVASAPLAAAAPASTALGAGALSGGLESHATVEQPTELAEDTGIGLITGLALHKLFPGGSIATEKDVLNQGEFMPQLKAATRMGEEGVSLSSKPAAREALTNRLQQNEQGIANKFIEPRKTLGKAIEAPLNEEGLALTQSAEALDAVKNVEEVLKNNAKGIGTGKAQDLIEKAQQLQQGLLSPAETYAFRKELGAISTRIASPEDQQIFRTGLDQIKNSVEESVPGVKDAVKDFAQFAEKGPESLLSKGYDPEIADVFLGDMSKGNLKISEKVRDLLGGIRSGGTEGLKKQGELFGAMKQLKELAQENPDLVQKLGIDPKKLTQEFINKADEMAVAQKTSGVSVAQKAFEQGKFGIRKATESGALKTANIYGQAKRTVRDFANSSTEQLRSAAEALKQHGGPDLQSLADTLVSELPHKRNAAIFSLLQLPKAKEILGIEADKNK